MSDTSNHIDLTTIDSLRKMQQAGRPDILHRVLSSFLKTSPHLLEDIRTAIENNDPEALRNAAHTMKSSNGQLGARQLAAMCYELELMGAMGAIVDGATLMTELEEEWHKVELALADIMRRHESS